ncbi:MAG: TlyA family rRNA (cytidine-2'-O)-methyltransferase [Chloroflexi bacterium 44-23]|nr:MAG: TlyA family rRNA (cytidine-2'-O)-methyltransferase [Chloroflexi bacterium 44-23]
MHKERIDLLLFERGLVESRSLAQRIIMAGNVRVDGQLVDKPSQKISRDAVISIDAGPKYVSRGGEKLEPALKQFMLTDLKGTICVDVGASTGGFSDCLLQHGALKVIAVDVGYGILHWKLRNDPRIEMRERTNARFIKDFSQKIDLVTVDASFISLKVLLPVIHNWLRVKGRVIALVKPQFEAGRKDAAKGAGVIRDHELHQRILLDIATAAASEGFLVRDFMQSPIIGPKGNIEFLLDLQKEASAQVIDEKIVDRISNFFEGIPPD